MPSGIDETVASDPTGSAFSNLVTKPLKTPREAIDPAASTLSDVRNLPPRAPAMEATQAGPSIGATSATDINDGRTIPASQFPEGAAPPPAHPNDIVVPTRINRFAVLRVLGRGGMGVVYAGYDEELDRRVAIKVVREDLSADSNGHTRILREAQAMAKLSHPNVVQVYEVGVHDGQVFVAMEFVRGYNLREWLAAEHRTWEEIVEVFLQAGQGLTAAHRQGIVHRDFKPDNVLIDGEGRVRVLDFGLARADREPQARNSSADSSVLLAVGQRTSMLTTELTVAGSIMGTPAYMSPEQFLGETSDWRSDQFSLCAAIYRAVYNQQPFGSPGDTFAALSHAVTSGLLNPPPADTPVPPWLFAALETGLAVNPEARHPSMETLLAALSPEPPASIGGRLWWPAVALIATLAMAVAGLWSSGQQTEPDTADLAAISKYVTAARAAAAEQLWVYPSVQDPQDTAYYRVVLLESLRGPAAAPAVAAANGLRSEFSSELIALGDRYFDDPDTRPFARDYYIQALIFTPRTEPAQSRAGTTLGQLADFERRASTASFLPVELYAAEPLRILASDTPEQAQARLLAFASDPERWSSVERAHLNALLRREGLSLPQSTSETYLANAFPIPPPPSPRSDPGFGDVLDDPIPPGVDKPSDIDTTPIVSTPTPKPTTRPLPRQDPPDAGKKPQVKPEPPPQTDAPVDDIDDIDGSNALVAQADAAMRRGETSSAQKLYNQALDAWHKNPAALMGLSDIAFEAGKFDSAAKYAEKAVRFAPNNRDYHLRLGDAYFKAFRYSEAEQRYQRAADLGHSKAAERLARVRAQLGN